MTKLTSSAAFINIRKTLKHLKNLSWQSSLFTTSDTPFCSFIFCFSDSCCSRLDRLLFIHLEMLVTLRFSLGFFLTITFHPGLYFKITLRYFYKTYVLPPSLQSLWSAVGPGTCILIELLQDCNACAWFSG